MTLIDVLDDRTFDDHPLGDRGDPAESRGAGAASGSVRDHGPVRARCADGNGTLTHLFFSDDEFDLARARAICGRCALADRCLAGALDRAEPYGIWGGRLVVDGRVVLVKRGRGRPPKQPRPPLVVDEVPVPPHLLAPTFVTPRAG